MQPLVQRRRRIKRQVRVKVIILQALRPLIIKSGNVSQYMVAIEGIQEAFQSAKFEVEWDTKTIGKNFQSSRLEEKVQSGSYDLIFTIGSSVLNFVKRISSETPVVYTMVMGFDSRRNSSKKRPVNITGVNLRVAPAIWGLIRI